MALPSPDEFQPYRGVQRRFDAETARILRATALAIERRLQQLDIKPGIGAQVRAAQLRLVLKEIDDLLRAMWLVGIIDTLRGGRKAAAEAAETAAERLERVAYAALGRKAAEALVDGFRATAQAGINSFYARIPRELSARVYHNWALSRGEVERMIRQGLLSGLNAKELAREVRRFIDPATPGGVSYAAMRLARTEINNAFHEQQKLAAARPGVRGVKWNLSDSHRVPDKCNVYAAQNAYDLGRGVFPIGKVPDKPHPHCFCFMTYDMMTPLQFRAALAAGQFDDELDRRTKANLARLGVAS